MKVFTHIYDRLGFSSRSGNGMHRHRGVGRYHRLVEPIDDPYWDGPGETGLDIVQEIPHGPWYVRAVKKQGQELSEPMTLREALVRVKLGVA